MQGHKMKYDIKLISGKNCYMCLMEKSDDEKINEMLNRDEKLNYIKIYESVFVTIKEEESLKYIFALAEEEFKYGFIDIKTNEIIGLGTITEGGKCAFTEVKKGDTPAELRIFMSNKILVNTNYWTEIFCLLLDYLLKTYKFNPISLKINRDDKSQADYNVLGFTETEDSGETLYLTYRDDTKDKFIGGKIKKLFLQIIPKKYYNNLWRKVYKKDMIEEQFKTCYLEISPEKFYKKCRHIA